MTRFYTLGFAALMLVPTGCDLVYSLDRPDASGDGPLPYDRCGPFLYDEALRYSAIPNPNIDEVGVIKAWSWTAARTACMARGMDLAVFNDEHELGMVSADAAWPYWIGASRSSATWSAVDDCPAMMPAGGGVDSCGIVPGPNTIDETACTGTMKTGKPEDPPVVLGALCETPRPTTDGCLGNDPMHTSYVMSPNAMSFSAARSFCADRGGHPVVFETHAEWLEIAKRIREEMHERFWVGATFDGTVWKTENKCPASFSWATGQPSEAPRANDCMGSVMLEVPDEDQPAHMVLTGVDRMECSAAEMHALCEI